MTTPIVPDYILKLFQDEIAKINILFMNTLCKTYDIDIEDAKKKMSKQMNISFEITKNEKIIIVKKQKELLPEERCIARVFRKKDLEVLQCTRRKPGEGCDFCKRHQVMHDEDRLKFGTIFEDTPDEISEKTLKKIKKHSLI